MFWKGSQRFKGLSGVFRGSLGDFLWGGLDYQGVSEGVRE